MNTITLDRTQRGLEKALELWKLSANADRIQRVEMAMELYEFEQFSLNQLAKITRLSVPTISRLVRPNSGGGKFSPESLAYLILIRKTVLTGEPIPKYILNSTVAAGTSISSIATLTGASSSSLYKQAA